MQLSAPELVIKPIAYSTVLSAPSQTKVRSFVKHALAETHTIS